MKRLVCFLLLVWVCTLGAQTYQNVFDNVLHGAPLSVSFQITSGTQSAADKDSIWIQFPTRSAAAKIDTIADESITTSGFTAGAQTIWNGHARANITVTNVDLALDSLQVIVYALDHNGAVLANDYAYLVFGTPPSWETTLSSAGTKTWVSATKYSALLTGAFPIGTHGLLFIVNINDATASHTGTGLLEVDYK